MGSWAIRKGDSRRCMARL